MININNEQYRYLKQIIQESSDISDADLKNLVIEKFLEINKELKRQRASFKVNDIGILLTIILDVLGDDVDFDYLDALGSGKLFRDEEYTKVRAKTPDKNHEKPIPSENTVEKIEIRPIKVLVTDNSPRQLIKLDKILEREKGNRAKEIPKTSDDVNYTIEGFLKQELEMEPEPEPVKIDLSVEKENMLKELIMRLLFKHPKMDLEKMVNFVNAEKSHILHVLNIMKNEGMVIESGDNTWKMK